MVNSFDADGDRTLGLSRNYTHHGDSERHDCVSVCVSHSGIPICCVSILSETPLRALTVHRVLPSLP